MKAGDKAGAASDIGDTKQGPVCYGGVDTVA